MKMLKLMTSLESNMFALLYNNENHKQGVNTCTS